MSASRRPKLCWECKHICYYPAQPHYSDLTPGSSMELRCGKNVWEFDQYDESIGGLRRCLEHAETCSMFEEAQHG